MSKYYTPKIEEFHVGFEYEFRHSDYKELGWKKYNTPEFNWEREDAITANSDMSQFRVKYLDQEDIELGFDREIVKNFTIRFRLRADKSSNDELFFQTYCLEKHTYLEDVYLLFYPNTKEVQIYNNLGTMFWGKIKNKSELKRVLTQIGIIKDE